MVDSHCHLDACEPAAAELKMREYFDWIQEKKPGAPPS